MHCGRTAGQGADGAGELLEAGMGELPLVDVGIAGAGVLGSGAMHLVQSVEV